nr:sister chromatid cohesion protein pds5 [Quercus suber]
MTSFDRELEKQLKEAGNRLLSPPSSIDDILTLLDEVENLIIVPDAPYKDEQMKEIFQLIVAAFENMSNVSTRSYKKVASILDIISKVRLSLVMLDLECDALVVEMFQSFLKIIRSNHPLAILSAKEKIMNLVIDESEDISLALLSSLFASVRKESENVSPTLRKFGEQIIIKINAQLEKIMAPT